MMTRIADGCRQRCQRTLPCYGHRQSASQMPNLGVKLVREVKRLVNGLFAVRQDINGKMTLVPSQALVFDLFDLFRNIFILWVHIFGLCIRVSDLFYQYVLVDPPIIHFQPPSTPPEPRLPDMSGSYIIHGLSLSVWKKHLLNLTLFTFLTEHPTLFSQ